MSDESWQELMRYKMITKAHSFDEVLKTLFILVDSKAGKKKK